MYSLSIVIPLFNEQKRLQKTLPKIYDFLARSKKNKIEIIFVSDGSYDETNSIINDFIKKNFKISRFKFIHYKNNVGKGFAIKKGVLAAKNKWILICDADLSVNPNQFEIWIKQNKILDNKTAYYGSREHKDSIIEASIIRKLLGYFFKLIIKILFNITLKDTQCGFKVFHRNYTKKIFKKLKSYRFAFDVELTILLKQNKINIIELPLKWYHRPDSKLNIFFDIPKMIYDIIIIKIKYFNQKFL